LWLISRLYTLAALKGPVQSNDAAPPHITAGGYKIKDFILSTVILESREERI
jgi:hypothetical protein